MKSIARKDKFFIGIVKFFDNDKDFGFITSNNCNMSISKYSLDFYVNSSSFIDNSSKKEGQIVVFQIGFNDGNNRTRAINVREISQSNEDINLALKYYGDHEWFILGTEKGKINIYKSFSIPTKDMIKRLKYNIKNEAKPSSIKTKKHFDFFFEHFSIKPKLETFEPSSFFSSVEDDIWEDFLSGFSVKELALIFDNFPYIIRYCKKKELISLWLDNNRLDNCPLFNLQELQKACYYLPHELSEYVISRIEEIVDTRIINHLQELSARSDIKEEELSAPDNNKEKLLLYTIRDASKKNAVSELWKYLRLTKKKYDHEKAECMAYVKKNLFKKELTDFVSQPLQQDRRRAFYSFLNSMSEKEIKQHEEEIRECVSAVLESYFKYDEKYVDNAADVISQLYWNNYLDKDFLLPYKQKLLSLSTKILSEYLHAMFRYSTRQKKEFYDYFHSLTSLNDNYYVDVIKGLPSTAIEGIINAISLNSFQSIDDKFYYKPFLKDKLLIEVLHNTSIDLFPYIANRILKLNLYDEQSILLAVLLTDLMTYNKPKEECNASSIWEEKFKSELEFLKKNNPSNKRLSAILWSVHFQTTTYISAITDIFAYLPPYVQILCVKKLFHLVSQGKIQQTATSLYEVISNAEKDICLPLEIVFSYLKLREKTPEATFNNNHMLQLISKREDHVEWNKIRYLLTSCLGRWNNTDGIDSSCNHILNSIITTNEDGKLQLFIPSQTDVDKTNFFLAIREAIQLTYQINDYILKIDSQGIRYCFESSYKTELYALVSSIYLKCNKLENFPNYGQDEWYNGFPVVQDFCECRLSDNDAIFYWCVNKPCFRPPVRYMFNDEWRQYTLLDFMRILNIPVNYIKKDGKSIMFGHYIIFSSFLKSFTEFYNHLLCRKCGNLMRPSNISNFAKTAVTEFSCSNDNCVERGKIVYINHCFNQPKCDAIIDSRDSKACPNLQYICPECGACCSTEIFGRRISNLKLAGGYISDRLIEFVQNDLGHLEKKMLFCYKCGNPMESNICRDCNTIYKKIK